jgi:NADPH-dependent 2,4-dienoyl-CoA reductase/sulfur reductase-like enzyme
LSKEVLLKPGREHAIGLIPEGALFASGVEMKLGRAASAIDRVAREVTLSDGERVRYDKLVLATGSRLRTLSTLPPGTPGVHYLRGLDDALALRAAIAQATQVVIVGGGVIGLEIAAAARVSGRPVMVIEAQHRVMSRTTAPLVSDFFQRRHTAEGVEFRFGLTVHGAAPVNGAGLELQLSDGTQIVADVVVVGIGVIANSTLAEDCGLTVQDKAILVDACGRTSDPSIFAAGEVTLHYSGLRGRHERQETWAHAAAHGYHVGRCAVGAESEYAEVASYWSDQYDINLQVFGAPAGEVDIVRGAPESGKFLVFHVAEGLVAGVSAINSVRELRAAKKLIGLQAPHDPNALADASVPLTASR